MKKFIAFILSLLMMLSLCACGDKGGESTESAESASSTAAQEKADFQFEIEDFEATLEDGELEVKVKIRNLTDKDIDHPFFSYQLLDENGDALTNKSQSLDTMLAGQASWKTIPVCSDSTDIDISEMKGICFTKISYKDNFDLRFGGTVKYDLADYIALEAENAVLYTLNDTVETDTVKLTVTEYFYGEEFVGKMGQYAKAMPNDGDIWACIALTMENVSKNQFRPYDVLSATIDYNDGYIYSTKDAVSALVKLPDFDLYFYEAGGTGMTQSPLSTLDYVLLISCSPKLQSDTDSPILITLELPDGEGTTAFTYKVQ